jgi:hypothetical protein
MAIATFITIAITLKQNREAVRARLLFSIVRKQHYVCLKVANVGNSVATDVHIRFSQNFKNILLTNSMKENYTLLERMSLSIDAHDAKFYYIVPACCTEGASYESSKGEKYNQELVNEWHNQYDDVEFQILGSYCSCSKKYKFQERISIHAFLNVAAVDENEIVELFRKQNTILKDVKVLLQKQFKEK